MRHDIDVVRAGATPAPGTPPRNRGAPQAIESCLVIGAGPIGLAAIEFVKLTGARLIVLDVNDKRLDFSKRSVRVRG